MALDKLVDSTQLDANLTTIADAIRAKGGTSAQLAFPAGFVSAVEAIETGGGAEYAVHTVYFALSTAAGYSAILNLYVQECKEWAIYPADADNTTTNTIATGTHYPEKSGGLGAITTPTGVTLKWFDYYYVNDQSYNAIRGRGNVGIKPAGNYVLKFYGIAK